MKKFLTVVLSLTLVAGACLGMAGCKPKKKEVIDAMFQSANATNYTVTYQRESAYSKEEVTATSAYASWEKSVTTTYFDYASLACATLSETESYQIEEGEGVSMKVKEERYAFAQGEGYFIVEVQNDGEPQVVKEYDHKITFEQEGLRAGFAATRGVNDAATSMSLMRSVLKWNKQATAYELAMGTKTYQATLLNEKDVYLKSFDLRETEWFAYTVSGVNGTAVSIPDKAKTAVDAYLANK